MSNHARLTRIVLVGDEEDGDTFRSICTTAPSLHSTVVHVKKVDELFSLSSNETFDVLLLALPQSGDHSSDLLRHVSETYPGTPIIVLVDSCSELLRHLLLRMGARKVLERQYLTSNRLAQTLREVSSGRESDRDERQRQSLEEVLRLLQQRIPLAEASPAREQCLRPLSEVMPQKFLELTKSYSNIVDLAMGRIGFGTRRFSGRSISQQLRYLASDLGTLNASVWDVLDVHARALEGREEEAVRPETEQLLVELLKNLSAFYKHAQYAFA